MSEESCDHEGRKSECPLCTRDARIAELEAECAVLREALLEVQNSPDPDELIDRALSTDASTRAAAVLKAAREWADNKRTPESSAQRLRDAIDALDGRVGRRTGAQP